MEEIAANDHNLNISLYIQPKDDQPVISVEEAMTKLRESAEAAFAAEDKLIDLLRKEGLLV